MVRLNLQLFAKSTTDLAKEVIKGNWGNGNERKTKLTNAGYNYAEVQAEVNRMLKGGSSTTTTTTDTPKATNTNNTNNTPKTPEIKGADNDYVDKMTSSFSVEDNEELNGLKDQATNIRNEALDFYGNTDIVDQSVYDGLREKFEPSESFKNAWAMIEKQQAEMASGKTAWTDQFNSYLNDYLNREKFEYDVDNDQLFQQALASAMNSGKTAMQDTIGQASSLTGGYGSTYATTAGNQAYNAFIEDAYNNLPEYYQMALEAYQAEGQEMANKVSMLAQADANEWQKMGDMLSMNVDIANSMFNQETTIYKNNIDRLTALGNIQLSENSQIGSNYYNAAQLSENAYQNAYSNYYTEWADSISQATEIVKLQNSDYWSEETFKEEQRQFNKTFDANYESDGNGGYQPKGSKAGSESDYSLGNTELEKSKKILEEGGTFEDVLTYLDAVGKTPSTPEEDAMLESWLGIDSGSTTSGVNADGTINWKNVDIEMVDDTMNGFLGLGALFGHYDTNDTIKVGGNAYKTSDVHAMIDADKTLTDTEKILLKKKIRDLSEGDVYNYSKK